MVVDMAYFRPRTLSDIALETVVKISLMTVIGHGSIKRKIGVDPKFNTLHSVICAIQNYVSVMPSTLMTEYAKRLITQSETRFKSEMEVEHYFPIIFEIILSPTLVRFSDRWMPVFCKRWSFIPCVDCIRWPERRRYCFQCIFNDCKKTSYPTFRDNLWKCSNLKELSLTTAPHAIIDEKSAASMFNNFSHLTTLLLVPSGGKVSFHWVIDHVIRSCPFLKEFHVAYDGRKLKDNGGGIEKLVQCQNLVSLCLYDFSYIVLDDLGEPLEILLRELRCLKHIYHKDLSFVLSALSLTYEITGTLGLERIDLAQKYIREYSYIYEPLPKDRDFLLALCKLCPATRVLKIYLPPQFLFEIISKFQNLEVLEIVQVMSITHNPLLNYHQNMLTSLTVLKIEYVTICLNYDFFSDLAHICPYLNVLSIVRANIKAEGHLTWPAYKSSAFPSLSKLELTPHVELRELEMTPHVNIWEVGKKLTYYLLKESYNLEYIHIHHIYIGRYDEPTNDFLCAIMEPLKNLIEVQLMSYYVEWNLIEQLLSNCPSLSKLSAIRSRLNPSMHMKTIPDHIVVRDYCDCSIF